MGSQAELIKDCMRRIRRLEFAVEREPESKEIQALLREEKELLDAIQKAD